MVAIREVPVPAHLSHFSDFSTFPPPATRRSASPTRIGFKHQAWVWDTITPPKTYVGEATMASSSNLAKLKDAYRRWDRSKGKDTSMWTDLFAPNVRLRSLAAGTPGLTFTLECRSQKDIARYFEGLTGEFEMVNYKTKEFAVDGDRIVMLGSTSWRHKKTGKTFDTPKADLVTFRKGRVIEFYELYDTEKVLATTRV